MKVEQVVFQSGERFPMLVGEMGVPDFWTTLYVSQRLRGNTQSSINSFLRSITVLYKWQKIHNRDLIREFEKESVPALKEVESLKEYCGLKSEYLKKELEGKSGSKLVKLTEFSLGNGSPMAQVGSNLQQRRMHDVSEFLAFVGREVVKRRNQASNLFSQIENMLKLFKAHYPKSNHSRGNKRLPHADKEAFLKFMEVTHVDSINNPFQGYENRLRNYLLIQVLYWTGARSGEVLSLTLDCIDYDKDNPKLLIPRTHDDPNDTRKYQPVTKTKGRSVPIPPSLRDDLDYYINKVRSKYPKSKTHPYLFVSHKGRTTGEPMTNSTFYNRVVQTVKSVDEERFNLVKRHGFRHFFNELYSERVDAHNQEIRQKILEVEKNGLFEEVALLKNQIITDQQEMDSRSYLMGWENNDSASPYIQRHIKKVAKDLHKKMMQKMSEISRRGQNK